MLKKLSNDKYTIIILITLIIVFSVIAVVGGNSREKDRVNYMAKAESDEIKSDENVMDSNDSYNNKSNANESESEDSNSKDSKTEDNKSEDNKSEDNKSDEKDTDSENETTSLSPEEKKKNEFNEKADKIIKKMSLEEKICQMFIIAPEQLTGVSSATEAGEMTKKAIEEKPVGGILFFANNITNPNQIKEMTANIKSYYKIKPFICVDEEGGRVARIGNNNGFDVKTYESASSVQKSDAYDMGKTIGTYLKEYGFNLDFAPVADINSNPNNPVIGDRAFGTDSETVASSVSECIKGFHDAGVMCTVKHFPGHGDTNEDSHYGMASTGKTLEELKNFEFIPFEKGIEAGVDLVMVGHINVPEVDDVPASLSKKMITDILKKDLGYEGLVITDSLNMKAVTDKYSGKECVMAIEAGADIILLPADFDKAFKSVLDAVNDGTISEKRIDDSVKKIVYKKLETGIHG